MLALESQLDARYDATIMNRHISTGILTPCVAASLALELVYILAPMSVRFYVFYRLSVPLLITFSDAPLDLRVGDDYSYGIILCIMYLPL